MLKNDFGKKLSNSKPNKDTGYKILKILNEQSKINDSKVL